MNRSAMQWVSLTVVVLLAHAAALQGVSVLRWPGGKANELPARAASFTVRQLTAAAQAAGPETPARVLATSALSQTIRQPAQKTPKKSAQAAPDTHLQTTLPEPQSSTRQTAGIEANRAAEHIEPAHSALNLGANADSMGETAATEQVDSPAPQAVSASAPRLASLPAPTASVPPPVTGALDLQTAANLPGATGAPGGTSASIASGAANAASPASLLPFAAPPSMRVSYNVSAENRGLPFRAQSELTWQRGSDAAYSIRFEVKALFFGARQQTSVGQIGPDALLPTRFSDKVRAEQAAHFDRERGQVSFSTQTAAVALLQGAQDRLSVFVQLASLVAADPARYGPGTGLAIQTFGVRGGGVWTFLAQADELLELPGGTLRTHKWLRPANSEYDQVIELWLAPDLGYLPARIRISQANGDFVDQQWRSHSPR